MADVKKVITLLIDSLQAELEQVQYQVGAFCERIEQLLWTYKEEEFQQSLKFVKDKDTEWNK